MSAVRRHVSRFVRRLVGFDQRLQDAIALPVGQINLEESLFLGQIIRDLKSPGPIIEVGTLFGWSTRVMAMFKQRNRELITVDSYVWNPLGLTPDDHFRATSRALADVISGHHVRVIRQDKNDFYRGYNGPPPALVFLDADHRFEATAEDIAWARKAGASRIALHDYGPHSPGVVQAVDAAGGITQVVGSLAILS